MSSSPSFLELWPAQTIAAVDAVSVPPPSPSPPPQRPRSPKRRRISEIYGIEPATGTSSKWARQLVTDQAEVGNSRRPELTQFNRVDIFLFRGDSLQQLLHFRNVVNPVDQAGSITAQVNDTWFGSDGLKWDGRNVSYPFYWVITRSDKELDGSQLPQSTFRAVRTSTGTSPVATGSSNGSLQPGSNDSSFPKWAIAVIVILGFLAIAATCILVFLIIRRMRRRNSEFGSNRNSMGSASPMIEHPAGNPQSPLLAGGVARQTSSVGQRAPSIVSPDGASEVSRANSADQGPFSGADAAIMAQAFRTALRKPDFANQPVEEGEPEAPQRHVLSRELAEEGRDLRSVSSSRGVKVETLSDQEGTIQDHR
ncbi:NAD(P)-binding protein [Salix suchowensis]|nr:NAD(P)-binding protein [Salix suchowensis]